MTRKHRPGDVGKFSKAAGLNQGSSPGLLSVPVSSSPRLCCKVTCGTEAGRHGHLRGLRPQRLCVLNLLALSLLFSKVTKTVVFCDKSLVRTYLCNLRKGSEICTVHFAQRPWMGFNGGVTPSTWSKMCCLLVYSTVFWGRAKNVIRFSEISVVKKVRDIAKNIIEGAGVTRNCVFSDVIVCSF